MVLWHIEKSRCEEVGRITIGATGMIIGTIHREATAIVRATPVNHITPMTDPITLVNLITINGVFMSLMTEVLVIDGNEGTASKIMETN